MTVSVNVEVARHAGALVVPRGAVQRVFLAQGAILGLAGSAIGIGLGIVLGLGFQGVATNPDGSPRFPVTLDAALYLRSAGIAVGVGIAAALIPARRAARMNPADAIRSG
jgi:lipoprotein-releasing system permease protein